MALTTEQLNLWLRAVPIASAAFYGHYDETGRVKTIYTSNSVPDNDLGSTPDEITQVKNEIALFIAFRTMMEGTIGGTGKTGVQISADSTLK